MSSSRERSVRCRHHSWMHSYRRDDRVRHAWPAVAAATAIGLSGAAEASVLTFDQVLTAAGSVVPTISGFAVPPGYGDRVTGAIVATPQGNYTYGQAGEGYTPNVLADFFSGSATPGGPAVSLWQQQYGDLTNVLFGNNNSQTLSVRLTADPGYTVQLFEFDLGGWRDADYTIAEVRVIASGTTLFAGQNVLVAGDFNGARHTGFDFTSPITATELSIEIDYSNLDPASHDNIGIDNIRFGQSPPAPVPVPTPLSLLLGAVLALGRMAVTRQRR